MGESVRASLSQTVAKIIVKIDLQQGLFESIELVVGDRLYTQALDNINVPFRCARCHFYGHVVVDCNQLFKRQVWWPKRELMQKEEVQDTQDKLPSFVEVVVLLDREGQDGLKTGKGGSYFGGALTRVFNW